MSIPSERKVTLDAGINSVIYTDTDTEGKKKEYVDDDIELYHNGESIGNLDEIRAVGRKNRAGNNIFSKNGVYLGKVEELKYAFTVKEKKGGARKSLRKRKNKKSRKGKSRKGKSRKGKSKKNRRKSNRRR